MKWLLVDRLVECVPGKTATAVKCFSRSDLLFQNHFAGFPTVPGVLQIEMIAQTAGKCIRIAHPEILTVLGSVKHSRFLKRIEPGYECTIRVEIMQLRKSYALAEGTIEVAGVKVCEARLMYGMLPATVLSADYQDEVINDWLKLQKEKS